MSDRNMVFSLPALCETSPEIAEKVDRFVSEVEPLVTSALEDGEKGEQRRLEKQKEQRTADAATKLAERNAGLAERVRNTPDMLASIDQRLQEITRLLTIQTNRG